jgi:hypothetical protein
LVLLLLLVLVSHHHHCLILVHMKIQLSVFKIVLLKRWEKKDGTIEEL